MSDSEVVAGRYRLVRTIGRGGMGTVWLAHDERLQRDVAVKRLNAVGALGEDAEIASERAMREARITARLHHPHAVSVFDVVEHDHQPCLVMQYFPSSSLAELAARPEGVSVEDAARIGSEVAAALHAAHDLGIVHRDVKPANVLIGGDGTAKISDFGIAHALGDATVTSIGLLTGTPGYLAPEVARGEPSTPASDVFSLGSTLYAALEGEPPFGTHDNPMALLHRVASGEHPPPQRSGALAPVLEEMLAPAPADRPDMAEVAARLAALGAAAPPVPAEDDDGDLLAVFRDEAPMAGASPAPPGPPTAPAPESPGPSRRRRALAVLALTAVIAAIALGVALTRGSEDPEAAPRGTRTPTATSSSTETTPTPSVRTTSPSPTPTPSPSRTPSPSPSPSSTPASADPTAAELREALRDYYALLPGDLDAGWARLTDRYRRTTAGSRDSYAAFWGDITRVRTSDVVARAPSEVTATLTYTFDDGRVVVERTAYRLVRDDGILKIDRSSVLSSRGG